MTWGFGNAKFVNNKLNTLPGAKVNWNGAPFEMTGDDEDDEQWERTREAYKKGGGRQVWEDEVVADMPWIYRAALGHRN